MVTWSDDINLERICEGINKYISNYEMRDYYIFGLQKEDRPHVRISPDCPQLLKDLFINSGYTLEIRANDERYCAECDTSHTQGDCHCDGDTRSNCQYCSPLIVSLGLRRDIRNDIDACRKLIKTIIFAMEDKLVLDKNSRLHLGRKVTKIVTKPKEEVKEEAPVLGMISSAIRGDEELFTPSSTRLINQLQQLDSFATVPEIAKENN